MPTTIICNPNGNFYRRVMKDVSVGSKGSSSNLLYIHTFLPLKFISELLQSTVNRQCSILSCNAFLSKKNLKNDGYLYEDFCYRSVLRLI